MDREPKYWDLVSDLSDWLRVAGDNAKAELIKDIKGRTYDRKKMVEYGLRSGYIKHLAADYSDTARWCGEHFVYLFVNELGNIYYVGCGDTCRLQGRTGRNNDFREQYFSGNSKVVLLAKWCIREVALQIEKYAIWECQMRGFNLTNKNCMLSEQKMEEIRNMPDDWHEYSEVQSEYEWALKEWPEAVEAFANIVEWLKTDEFRNNTDFVNIKSTDVPTLACWTIDGVTKSRAEWCKEYGVNQSIVLKRMEKHGCTPKEAFTFPPIPKDMTKRPKEWWAEHGFVAGTDKTSYVTPLEEWPSHYKARNM